jgi:hypothetical protein
MWPRTPDEEEAGVVLPRLREEAEARGDGEDSYGKRVFVPMSYQHRHYTAVFEAMRRIYGEDWYEAVDWRIWGVVWRAQIKRLFFDQDILIPEMVGAMKEAAEKRHWPSGTSYFIRLRDVCLKNRLEADGRQPVRRSEPEGIGAILKARGM